MLAWAARARLLPGSARAPPPPPGAPAPSAVLVAAGAGAALLTRTAAHYAFMAHRRATCTPDIIAKLGNAFEDTFDAAR